MSVLHLSIFPKGSEHSYDSRYSSSITLAQLKTKLELVVGVLSENMQLELFNSEGKFVSELKNNEKTLQELSVNDNSSIHVTDILGATPYFDTSSNYSERYIMDNSKYDGLKDSVRKWKNDLSLSLNVNDTRIPEFVEVGRNCVVQIGNQSNRKGKIVYVGKTQFKPGNWVGVVYDEPVGKHDGLVDGHRYFTCEPNHGSFVLPKYVIPIVEETELPIINPPELIEEI